MDESSSPRPHHFLLQGSRNELPSSNDHGGIVFVLEAVFALEDSDRDLGRNE